MNRNSLLILTVIFSSCGNPENVKSFSNTPAFDLAKSVYLADSVSIKSISKENPAFLNSPSEEGYNVAILAILLRDFDTFKLLVQHGSDPNYINPSNLESTLLYAIRYYGSSSEWIIDTRFIEFLLDQGANPNYKIDSTFVRTDGMRVVADSPLLKASTMDLSLVKILLKNGAEYEMVGGRTPLAKSLAHRKFEIIDFYIDSLKIDISQPVSILSEDSLYIVDYISKFMNYEIDSEGYRKKEALLKKINSFK